MGIFSNNDLKETQQDLNASEIEETAGRNNQQWLRDHGFPQDMIDIAGEVGQEAADAADQD